VTAEDPICQGSIYQFPDSGVPWSDHTSPGKGWHNFDRFLSTRVLPFQVGCQEYRRTTWLASYLHTRRPSPLGSITVAS
jgi:hypothetical protein